ncbi:MAG: TRAP transporter TatT component family protein [Treponema sp.]|jgi:predicted anti-sigma-YlaC factor YlaD|nr:TRAP transporter TatT component family protein [Treponema sp.]
MADGVQPSKDLGFHAVIFMKVWQFVTLALVSVILSTSCTGMAMNMVADALTGDDASEVFTGDDDPELVGDAIPFAIKMYESLLAGNPKHQGLIVTTGSLYIMYANAFVQGPAEMLPSNKFEEREAGKKRAEKFYIRGSRLLFNGLELKFPGFVDAFFPEQDAFTQETDEKVRNKFLSKLKKADVPLIYWTAAASLSAFSLNPLTNVDFGLRIPALITLVERAYELDPDFGGSSLDEFFVLVYGSLPDYMGGDKARAETHYQLALEKSQGLSASPYVAYAQAIAQPAQDYETWKACLEQALAIDVDAAPSKRLENILAQRKARYLLDNAIYFFADIGADDDWGDWDFDTGDGWDDATEFQPSQVDE